jgi:hypothetical protein
VAVSPFSVRGEGFKAREPVLVGLTSGRLHVERHVRASVGGTFLVTFATVKVSACRGYVVRALGSRGSVAIARSPSVRCPPRP